MTQTQTPEVSVKPTRVTAPERIFLQPECCVDPYGEGRQWCEDDVWEECGEPGCQCKSVRYVREDLASQTPPATGQGEWRVNPETPSVIITPHGRISVNWSVQRQGDSNDFSHAEETAAMIVAAVNSRAAPPATQPGATVGQEQAEALQKLQDFLREPDWAERFSQRDLIDWMNRRPTHIIPAILATLHTPPPVATATVVDAGWQGIASAPRDGTIIDLWGAELGRVTDCYWGRPHHECGEMGQYCDSDWHGDTRESWVDGTFNKRLSDTFITHWMPRPATPTPPAGER